jgi:hypothetical protein
LFSSDTTCIILSIDLLIDGIFINYKSFNFKHLIVLELL